MKKLFIMLVMFLLVVPNPISAAEAKTLYDLYRAERESRGLQPQIAYVDEDNPDHFDPYAYINRDYRDSVDLMFQIMQDTPIKKREIPFWKEPWFWFIIGAAAERALESQLSRS